MPVQALEIARSALMASRAGIEVSGQNIANANTPGYVRQRVMLAPVAYGDPNGGTGLVGGGVEVLTVQRLRNQALEAQIFHQVGLQGQEQGQADSLSRLQSYFPDLSGNGIAEALGGLFDSLQRLQTTPASTPARNEVLFAAQTLSGLINGTSAKLTEERSLLESDLAQQVDQANQLLHRVGELNGRITALGDNPQANDLKVMREEAIRQLAQLCGASGLDQDTGSQDVLLGGLRLVQGSDVTELSLVADPADPLRHTVAVGDVTQVDALAGQMGGTIQARDENLAGWQQSLDDLAASFAEAFNAQHRAGYDLHNHAGTDFFVYDPAAPAATLRVAQALLDDPTLLAAAGAVGGPPGDAANLVGLLNLRQEKILAGGAQTAEEFYGDLLYDVGAQTQRTADAQEARAGIVRALDTQYNNEAGVSLDEEAVEVMRFQQVYTAAIKLIQTTDQLMDQVMGLLD